MFTLYAVVITFFFVLFVLKVPIMLEGNGFLMSIYIIKAHTSAI